MLNLAMLLEDSAREVPERTAVVCEETRLSYAELNAATSQVAHGLVQAGIQKGDTVALSCQDVPSFVIAYYGILKAGAAVLPLNALLKLLPRFSPDAALHLMEEENITIFAGVPTMYWAMLHYSRADQYDLQKIARNLRVTVSGGAAMPVEVMRAFNEKFNVKILEGYGLSETSPIAVFNRLDREARPGSIAFPVWGVEVRLVDADDRDVEAGEVGEIAIRYPRLIEFRTELPMTATGKMLKSELRS